MIIVAAAALMRRRRLRVPKAFDFVFEVKFLALEFVDLGVVRGRMVHLGHNRFFNGLVTAHQFAEMRINRHGTAPSCSNDEIVTYPAERASGKMVANCGFV
jgi:hypothetical protein